VKVTNLFSQKAAELSPHILTQGYAGEKLMVTHVLVEANAVSQPHSHPHEQMMLVMRGELELTLGEERRVLKAGDVVFIPGNVTHGVTSFAETELVEVFTPVRDDLVEKLASYTDN